MTTDHQTRVVHTIAAAVDIVRDMLEYAGEMSVVKK